MNVPLQYAWCETVGHTIRLFRSWAMRYRLPTAAPKALILFFAIVLLAGCGNPYEKSKQKRADHAAQEQGDVVVAVVWPHLEPPKLFVEGVDLAVGQINAKGGILGRRFRAVHFKDTDKSGDYFDAEKIAHNTDIIAVVGHYHSDATLSALITYEYKGILLLIGAATNPILLEQEFEYVFRPIPNDHVFAESLARYAQQAGYKDIVIVDNNTLYGKGLAESFYRQATDLELNIVVQRGYMPWQNNFRPLISQINKLQCDALFLSGVLPRAGEFIKQMRQMGVYIPVLSGEGLNAQEFIDIAGEAADGTVVPSIFRPTLSDPLYSGFVLAFREKYGRDPDQYAVRGYDTIMLLDHIINTGGSTEPLVLASILRYTRNWHGIIGNYTFMENGELAERKIFFKQVRNGQFVDMEE